jgi:hypothetical protein
MIRILTSRQPYLAMATIDHDTSTASHTPITSHKSTTSDPNHLLCQDHQDWDDIPGVILDSDGGNLKSRSQWEKWYPGYVAPTPHAMDELCRNSQCLVCATTAVAVTTRIQNRDPRLQTWPLTKIKVTITPKLKGRSAGLKRRSTGVLWRCGTWAEPARLAASTLSQKWERFC